MFYSSWGESGMKKTVAYLIDNNIDRIVLGTVAVTNSKL